jgi:glycosyltransferase involved in cell wall biosynthesis
VPKDELLPWMSDLAAGIRRDWEAEIPDIVHAHFWMSGLAALEAASAGTADRVPVVQTFHALGTVKRRHQGNADTSPEARRWLEPAVGRSADHIIATCPDEVFELKAMGIDTSKVSIAPCGVAAELFTPEGPTSTRTSRRHRILSVGRLVPRKGVDTVIEALALLRDRGFADTELLIVGGGGNTGSDTDPESTRLALLAADLGLRGHVKFLGQVPREDMPAIFRSADAVVCTPWYEPFGIVPLEAMACGIPVVAAAVGGLADTVLDKRTGLHVPPRCPEATAEALALLLSSPQLRQDLGAAGRIRAASRYSWDRVAADTEKAYRLTLATRSAGSSPAALKGAAL